MNGSGLMIAVACFLCIGLFHPIVIKAEYYLSAKCWPLFFFAGVICLAVSLCMETVYLSAIMGIIGCSFLWSILELKEQEKRVERGWFPKNPQRWRRKKRKGMTVHEVYKIREF